MTNEDTSLFGICKNCFLNLQYITQRVNDSKPNLRLQDVRLFEGPNYREILVFDLYPNLRELAWVAKGFGGTFELGGSPLKELDRGSFKPAKHPFLLFLKAHFVGHCLKELRHNEDELEFLFEGQRSFTWKLSTKEWVFQIEGKKDYLQRLPQWASFQTKKTAEIEEKKAEVEVPFVDLKFEKLKANIQGDVKESEKWLEKNHSHIQFFFQNPMLWGAKLNEIPEEHHSWIKSISAQISFVDKDRKTSLEKLKKNLSRYERKKVKAIERLSALKEPVQRKAPVQKSEHEKREENKTTLGKKVEIAPGVEVIVGRNSEENDLLYKKAHSRDVWFHVRGLKGAHVWMRRGQKGFGAKDEASELLLQKAALLAAKQSKASGSWIAVDYTERRHLKKSRSAAPGALQVLQSKTIFVSLDE